ncbi:hypothetical protein [Micromonospora sp. CV4]|uniref:hypothetical protein n=1 Tax=Micromonospora sp. CV4 TaxID=2478711 RepID=UPI000EF44BDA|nr:hypothetical protein [Micromonospora sp. CV4]RLP87114.1 hypothetical protein EAD98_27375 [Micromonospora sp. CV4]
MDDLERELRGLSAWLETPDAPDVTARVRARLTTPRRRRWRAWAAAALVALVVAVLPPGRAALADAVAGLLRFAGVTVVTSSGPVLPTGTPSPLPAQRAAALDEAQRAVRFPIRLPATLGPPERVLVADPDDTGACRVATLLYRGGALRIDAFDGRLDLAFHKETNRPGAAWVQVDGEFAVWVDGPHVLSYVDRTGEVRKETARLAASTLIWQDADVSYRLEGDLTRAEAIEIARSLD